MADIASVPIRYHDGESPYQYTEDNKPLQDLSQRIVLVNTETEKNSQEIQAARGSKDTLAERLDAALNADGTLKPDLIEGLSATQIEEETSSPAADADRVWMTRAEKAKLEAIAAKANRLTLSLGNGEPFEGAVNVSLGNTLRGGVKATSGGTIEIFLDTVFSADRLHEHRYYQNILQYNNSVGLFSNTDDYVIPGSIRLYINGQMQAKSDFEEYVDQSTGKISGVYVTSPIAESIDLSIDKMWVEYDVRVKLSTETSALSGGDLGAMARYERTVEADTDLPLVRLPVDSGAAQPYQFWMFDITGLELSAPYDKFLLFITSGARTASNGRVMASYGIDWDIVSLNGNRYLRWRYDRNPGATSGVPDETTTPDRWEFLTESGAGSVETPATQFATFDLTDGAHFDLIYYSK